MGRLENAGLACDPPLSAVELVTATRVRSDPTVLAKLAGLRRSLAEAASVVAPQFGPMAVAEDWNRVRVDGGVHRSWWVARWPRRDVPAAWLDQLLFGVSCTRTLTVVFEPVPPSRSDRDIDRETVVRATNAGGPGTARVPGQGGGPQSRPRRATPRTRAGRRLCGTPLRRVADRHGHGPRPAAGDRRRVEQAAAQAGIELQALYGRQAAGWAASLPFGRTVARRHR